MVWASLEHKIASGPNFRIISASSVIVFKAPLVGMVTAPLCNLHLTYLGFSFGM